jgi:uncharacterized protein YlxW (UPF0749 family)
MMARSPAALLDAMRHRFAGRAATDVRPSGSVPSGPDGLRDGDDPMSPELSVDFLTQLFRHPLDAGYAQAAEAHGRSGPPSSRSRRTGLALRTVILVATGLLLVVAYQQTVAAQPEAAKTRDSLARDVAARQSETDAQQAEAEKLRQQAATLRDAIVGPNASAIDQLEARTGLGAVTGDGVTVTLASGRVPTDPLTGKPQANNQGHIVDFDLQTISNELWHDGAEAISINGQRLIGTSAIRAAGNAILVDLAPLTEPYTIQAIGPSSMADTLRRSPVGGFYSYLATSYGVKFAARPASHLSLGAAADPQLRYAAPITPQSPAPATSKQAPRSSSSPSPGSSSPRPAPSSGGP